MSVKRVNDLTTFSLTQYLHPDYWGRYNEDDDLKQAIDTKDLKLLTEWIISCLEIEGTGWKVEEAYTIIHDSDTREAWDEKVFELVIVPKREHIHGSFRFAKGCNKNANVFTISQVLGLESQFIEKPKAGKYSWNNQLSYLVHAKDKDKFQYSSDKVYTARGTDYTKIYHENKDMWDRGAIKKANAKTKEDIDVLENKILRGEVTKEQVLLTDEYYAIYAQNKRRVDDALDIYGQRKIYKTLQKLKNGEFKVSVYFITGKAGAGKTRFANAFIDQMISEAKEMFDEDWTVCHTASTNPVDDYNGQEIVLMDDVRGSSMRADDWLKLLDPWNVSPSSARYNNKVVAARAIVITSTLEPCEFFYYTKGVGRGTGQEEAIDQFLRRLMAIIKVVHYPSETGDTLQVVRPVHQPELCEHYVGADTETIPNQKIAKYVASNYHLMEDSNISNLEGMDDRLKSLTAEVMANNNLKGDEKH